MKKYKIYGDTEYLDEIPLLDVTNRNVSFACYMININKIDQRIINRLIDKEREFSELFLSSLIESVYRTMLW